MVEGNQWEYANLTILRRLRAVIPLTCLLETLLQPGGRVGFAIVGMIALIDLLRQESPRARAFSLSRAAWRDGAYAAAIYVLYIARVHVPALVLAPVPVMEWALLATPALARKLLPALPAMVAVRRMVIVRQGLPFLHLAWPVYLFAATAAALLISWLLRQHGRSQLAARTMARQHQEILSHFVSFLLEENNVAVTGHQSAAIERLVTMTCGSSAPEASESLAKEVAAAIKEHLQAQNLLTPREKEILGCMARGYSYRIIAQTLQVSEGTIRAHAANIMQKAGVHNRLEAVRWAEGLRVLPVDPVGPGSSQDARGRSAPN